MMVTPEQWRRPDHWKHGLDPDPLHVPEVEMSTEDTDRRVAKLVGAAVLLGAIVLLIREAIS